MDNNNYPGNYNSFECLLATGSKRSIILTPGNAFNSLKLFYDEKPGWLFGHLGYDIKNEQNNFLSNGGFNDGFFFSPEIVLTLTKDTLKIETSGDAKTIFKSINEVEPITSGGRSINTINILPKLSRSEYIHIIAKIKEHIQRGDCYELNFCQEFYSPDAEINPLSIFKNLQRVSPNPFSAFYRVHDNYCMCASPERFLKKTGLQLISQPMKGTSLRNNDPVIDKKNIDYLKESPKERSENVMVVDLVRNDLSKICVEGSVQVEEMFSVYSFPHVHQMISTIKGVLPADIHWTQALSATFPMGSMTGAPKKKVIELIAQYEKSKRGLFSGSIGYVTPNGDFDFNVVIRSIFYNLENRYMSFQAGSGITFNSDPYLEFDECLAKIEAIKIVLKN
jgi:para-aminobenzoate synthetase component 1